MPKKRNKRKAIQAQKRRAQAEQTARKNKRWPGTRRIALIAHHDRSFGTLMALMLAMERAQAMQKTEQRNIDGAA